MRTRGLSRSSKLKSEGRTPILAWPHDESNLSLWSNYWENEGWRADSTVKARLATNKKNVRAAENCRCWCTDPISSCFTTSLEYVFFYKEILRGEGWGCVSSVTEEEHWLADRIPGDASRGRKTVLSQRKESQDCTCYELWRPISFLWKTTGWINPVGFF